MGTFKHMVCRGTFYYLCGVRDQLVWNELMLASLGVSAQPLLEDLWFWSAKCARYHAYRRPRLQNCWQVMHCGQGGGICRASSEAKLHGIHGGKNGGRACWAVPRTICRDRDNLKCQECKFYHQVITEQLDYVLDSKSLKELLRMWL
jgi:hypothetical protein